MAKKTVTLIQRFFALHELQRLLYEQNLETCKEHHKQPLEISRRLNALLCSIRKIIENIMEQEEQSEKAQKALIASHRRRNVELGTLRLSTAP